MSDKSLQDSINSLEQTLAQLRSEFPYLQIRRSPSDWYLWFSLAQEGNRDAFVANHLKLRADFTNFCKKYKHLQYHDGDFDKLPGCIIVLAPRSVPSSRYAMAKTSTDYKTELDSLKLDLESISLGRRVIGPTNDLRDIELYGDNFVLQGIFDSRSKGYK